MKKFVTLILSENEVKELIADHWDADPEGVTLRVHNGMLEAVVPLEEEEEDC